MNDSDPFPDSHRRPNFFRQIALASVVIASLAFFVFPQKASAQSSLWEMKEFNVEIDVQDNGSFFVQEEIVANFLKERHGIFRYVPRKGLLDNGTKYKIGVDLISVKDQDGNKYKVQETSKGDNLVWRIGDANLTFTGEKTYVITYLVHDAIRRFEDVDELYWNVTGEGWDIELPKVKVVVNYPSTRASKVQATCYYGPYGSENTEECFVLVSDSMSGFGTTISGNPLTVAVGWEKGLIGYPSLLDRVSAVVNAEWPWGIPILVFFIMLAIWGWKGDDPELGAIVTQFEPPQGFRPGEVMALLRQEGSGKDISPTIVDLAVRGYISIEQTGGVWTRDYILNKEKEFINDKDLEEYEKYLLGRIFKIKESIKISSLRGRFKSEAKTFAKKLTEGLKKDGYFQGHPKRTRAIFVGIGSALSIGGVFIILQTGSGFRFIGPVILSGIIIWFFGWHMPKWSKKGRAMAKHIKGYKTFIKKVEQHRAPWMEQEGVFEKVLPYAIAFGLGKKWAKAFADLKTAPPTWYSGGSGDWSPTSFASSMNSFASSMSSSSGGSGGGGSSGGGSGGGGGGSW